MILNIMFKVLSSTFHIGAVYFKLVHKVIRSAKWIEYV